MISHSALWECHGSEPHTQDRDWSYLLHTQWWGAALKVGQGQAQTSGRTGLDLLLSWGLVGGKPQVPAVTLCFLSLVSTTFGAASAVGRDKTHFQQAVAKS